MSATLSNTPSTYVPPHPDATGIMATAQSSDGFYGILPHYADLRPQITISFATLIGPSPSRKSHDDTRRSILLPVAHPGLKADLGLRTSGRASRSARSGRVACAQLLHLTRYARESTYLSKSLVSSHQRELPRFTVTNQVRSGVP
jgi:hypothetical protein